MACARAFAVRAYRFAPGCGDHLFVYSRFAVSYRAARHGDWSHVQADSPIAGMEPSVMIDKLWISSRYVRMISRW
jgi:hypothetical protein